MSNCTDACVARQTCTTCRKRKSPCGRSVPAEMHGSLCDDDCPGYRQEPKPGHLWPGEEQP